METRSGKRLTLFSGMTALQFLEYARKPTKSDNASNVTEETDIQDSGDEYVPESGSASSTSSEIGFQVFESASQVADRPQVQTVQRELTNRPQVETTQSEGVPASESDDQSSKARLRFVFRNVTVACSPVKENGRRNYRKPDYCFFCNGRYNSKISVHYFQIHADEERFATIAALPVGSKERKRKLALLQNEGNHKHNIEVLQNGKGEITVARRPKDKDSSNPEHYLPCIHCFAWIFDKNLSAHAQKCPAACPLQRNSNHLRDSRMLLMPFLSSDDNEVDLEVEEIFAYMKETVKNLGLRQLGKGDELTREFCKGLCQKLGTVTEQRRKDKDNIRNKVRAITRLLTALQKNTKEDNTLDYFICPTKFMLIVKTVKEMALECNSPNLALTLGHYIKQVCQLKRSLALRSRDDNRKRQADDFDILYEAHWKNYVSSVALRRLKLRTMNAKVDIPKTSDLVLLRDFLDTEIQERVRIPKPSYTEWSDTAQFIMVRIILFNKRRVSEVEELKVSDFKATSASTLNEDIISQLDVTEQALAKRMTVIEVRGKSTRRLRKMFIIISDEMKAALNYLLATRLFAGIDPENPYMFARKGGGPLDGCRAMRDVPEKCPFLEEPQLIRTRLLRKYLATTVQVLDMSGEELQMIADHMGHSVSVHTDVYRLQSSVLEKTKVARALTVLESGQLTKYAGRNISSLNLQDLPPPLDPKEMDDFEETEISVSQANDDNVCGAACFEPCDSIETDSPFTNPCDDNDQPDVSSTIVASESNRNNVRKRKRWETEEESALFKAFKRFISEKKNVSNQEIKRAQEENPELRGRSIPVIKAKTNNIILGKCKTFTK